VPRLRIEAVREPRLDCNPCLFANPDICISKVAQALLSEAKRRSIVRSSLASSLAVGSL